MASSNDLPGEPAAQLGLWDSVSIIVGIVVGTAIFRAPPGIFGNVQGPLQLAVVWLIGGIVALSGALCYAELASTYPRSGGDYNYLTSAFGSWIAYMYGWAHLAVVLTGSVGAMAYVFSDYGMRLARLEGADQVQVAGVVVSVQVVAVAWAVAPIVVLTVMNMFGVVFGRWVQNALTGLKVFGLLMLVVAGFAWGGGQPLTPTKPISGPGLSLALILVLYAYGGWNDAALVASDVRNPTRNVPRALILGTTLVLLIYLLVNAAYLWSLGFQGARDTSVPAADVLERMLGSAGGSAMCVMVMISALGAINGTIFTGSRLYARLGTDHSIFSLLGRWHPRFGTPIWAFVVQAVIAVSMILVVGTQAGRDRVDQMLHAVGMDSIEWGDYGGGFAMLVSATAPIFWTFFLLTGLSLFVLRIRDRATPRPFRVPLYPLTPVLFCASSSYMLYSSIVYARHLALLAAIPVLLGLPFYWNWIDPRKKT